jgi:sulfide dehydrogenase cytochrome subunit
MESFRSGETESTVMGRQAKGYTDEEILLIAEYFAGQK